MRFEWDDAKNRSNIRKTAWISRMRRKCSRAFSRPGLIPASDYSEERWIGIGMLAKGIIALVVFCQPIEGVIRIISLRKADREEQREYEAAIRNGLEAD